MNFLELAADRYSVREFSPRPVEEEKMKKILAAAKVAPTAVNFQPQKLYVIKSPEAVARLSGLRNIFGAPVAVVVCCTNPCRGAAAIAAESSNVMI